MEINTSVNRLVSEYANETRRIYLYFAVGFLVPFTLGHPQLLVGVVVNTILVLTALEISTFRGMLPLLFAPSMGVLARGLIFGPYTPFLTIMVPFIWMGNVLLVLFVRELYKNGKNNYGISLGVGAMVKASFLFSAAFTLVSLSVLPALFLETMGVFQLTTAIAGGAAAFGLHKSGITRFARF